MGHKSKVHLCSRYICIMGWPGSLLHSCTGWSIRAADDAHSVRGNVSMVHDALGFKVSGWKLHRLKCTLDVSLSKASHGTIHIIFKVAGTVRWYFLDINDCCIDFHTYSWNSPLHLQICLFLNPPNFLSTTRTFLYSLTSGVARLFISFKILGRWLHIGKN